MKVFFVSLGCDKNTVDSEMMLGILAENGHEITYEEKEAEAVIINSCAFIADAKQESINTILEMAELKKEGTLKYIILTGCLGERYKEEVQREIPEVDVILGIQSFDEIAQALNDCANGKKSNSFGSLADAPVAGHKRLLTTPTHYAYMKIAEGCDKHCTYCIIPSFKGRYRSVPMDILVKEATELADRGVKELILVAQETTIYGTDLYGKKSLPELLHKLAAIDDIERIRILYCYPEEINDELIETIKREPKVCHYLDMPIQHASDNILARMARKTSEKDLREIVDKLRREIPDICIRTTLITGFPGETSKDFKILMNFVRDIRFDRLGVFTYSPEEGTPAATMPHQLPEWIKRKRRDKLMKLQQSIVFDNNTKAVNSVYEVTVEGRLVEDDVYVTRSYKDAPGVDGYVFVHSDRELISGDTLRVRVTEAKGYDLVAEEIITD